MLSIHRISALTIVAIGCLAGSAAAVAEGGKFKLSDNNMDTVSAGVAVLAVANGTQVAVTATNANDQVGTGFSAACCGSSSASSVTTSGGNGRTVTTRVPFASISFGAVVNVKPFKVNRIRIRH